MTKLRCRGLVALQPVAGYPKGLADASVASWLATRWLPAVRGKADVELDAADRRLREEAGGLERSGNELGPNAYRMLMEIVSGGVHGGRRAGAWYLRMQAHKVRPDEQTALCLLRSHTRCVRADPTRLAAVWRTVTEHVNPPPLPLYNTYLRGLLRGGLREEARGVLAAMRKSGAEPSLVTATILIDTAETYAEAVELFKEVVAGGAMADYPVYKAVLHSAAKAGLPHECRRLLREMQELGVRADITAYQSLLASLGRDASQFDVGRAIARAWGEAEAMGLRHDLTSFHLVFRLLSLHAKSPKDAYVRCAKRVAKRMDTAGVAPSTRSAELLMLVCLHAADVEAAEWFRRFFSGFGLSFGEGALRSKILEVYAAASRREDEPELVPLVLYQDKDLDEFLSHVKV
ncbi:Pentatricopeptide repeat-containing protein [Diplonema papillatum]|nr:Pentatricopeptide repeat-containing protein [Diplonema papillatum]